MGDFLFVLNLPANIYRISSLDQIPLSVPMDLLTDPTHSGTVYHSNLHFSKGLALLFLNSHLYSVVPLFLSPHLQYPQGSCTFL